MRPLDKRSQERLQHHRRPGLNGYAKDPARQALAQPGRRRVRGIAACSLFTALLLIAANIRKIRA